MKFSSSYLQILIEVDDAFLCISCASVIVMLSYFDV